jgi:hypothetical protein
MGLETERANKALAHSELLLGRSSSFLEIVERWWRADDGSADIVQSRVEVSRMREVHR